MPTALAPFALMARPGLGEKECGDLATSSKPEAYCETSATSWGKTQDSLRPQMQKAQEGSLSQAYDRPSLHPHSANQWDGGGIYTVTGGREKEAAAHTKQGVPTAHAARAHSVHSSFQTRRPSADCLRCMHFMTSWGLCWLRHMRRSIERCTECSFYQNQVTQGPFHTS